MKRNSTHLPESLHRHLSDTDPDERFSTASYVDRGGELTTEAALEALDKLIPDLSAKAAELQETVLLRSRLELLITCYREMRAERRAATPLLREIAFALLYFLKGADRIPDSVPEIGLLDDALVVQLVLERHMAGLRSHWERHGRRWTERAQALGF